MEQEAKNDTKWIAMGKTLLEKFKYPVEMLPLMYVMLKDDNGDFKKTCREVVEGQSAVHEYIFIDRNPKPAYDEILLENSQELLKKFSYPFETSPLMYMVLKTCGGDMAKACQEIENGQAVVKRN